MVLSFYYSRVPVETHKLTSPNQFLRFSHFRNIYFLHTFGNQIWNQSALTADLGAFWIFNRLKQKDKKRIYWNILKHKNVGKSSLSAAETLWPNLSCGNCELTVSCDGAFRKTSSKMDEWTWLRRDAELPGTVCKVQSLKEIQQKCLKLHSEGMFADGPWFHRHHCRAAASCQTQSQLNHL